MADVTINQLTAGTPNKNSAIIPYSDGSTTYKTSPSGIVAASPGCILQVKQSIKTDLFTSATKGSWVTLPGLQVNITPSGLTNKILITAEIQASDENNYPPLMSISRNNSIVTPSGTIAGSTYAGYASFAGGVAGGAGSFQRVTFSYLDSPNTTNSCTYEVKLLKPTQAVTNIVINSIGSSVTYSTCSTITCMEIAG